MLSDDLFNKTEFHIHGYKVTLFKMFDKKSKDRLIIKPENPDRPIVDYFPSLGYGTIKLERSFIPDDIPIVKKYIDDANALIHELQLNNEIKKLNLL